MKRREFVSLIGGAAAWPLAARAQRTMPVVGFINGSKQSTAPWETAAFRKGLTETGYVAGRNVTVEYNWMEGQYDRLPAPMADPVRRRVVVIATPASSPASIAAKAATIPIVFGIRGAIVRANVFGESPCRPTDANS